MTVVGPVVIGIIGAWVGYRIGHALGWTTDAEFPLTIGGGTGAIILSILISFGSVMAGAGLFVARPLRGVRRPATTGSPARATVRRMSRTGFSTTPGGGGRQRLLGFELDALPTRRGPPSTSSARPSSAGPSGSRSAPASRRSGSTSPA